MRRFFFILVVDVGGWWRVGQTFWFFKCLHIDMVHPLGIGFFFYYTYDFFIIPNFCLLYLILLIPEIVGIIKLGITNDFGISLSISKIIVK